MLLAKFILLPALYTTPAIPETVPETSPAEVAVSVDDPLKAIRKFFLNMFGKKGHRRTSRAIGESPGGGGGSDPDPGDTKPPGGAGNKPVPEPGSLALLGLGIAGASAGARRRRKQKAVDQD